MKTIGLIGGMSAESTVSYYTFINRAVNRRLGGHHAAKIILYSVDFAEIERCQTQNDWDGAAAILQRAAKAVERGGADFMLLCTNTMHKVADAIQAAVRPPLIHIADATAEALLADGHRRIALLGTRYTMEETFYSDVLNRHGIETLIPAAPQRKRIDDVIFKELCHGVIEESSRRYYSDVISDLKEKGATAAVLGCTEIGLLLKSDDAALPLYDTTTLHAGKAVELALQDR